MPVNLALIPIANNLKADLNTIQWVLSGYILGWVLLVIPGGKYADYLDKKFLYLLGLGLFLLASTLAGLAFSPAILITFAFSGLNAGIVKTVQAEYVGIASSLFLIFGLVGNALGVTFTTINYQFYALKALLVNFSQTVLSTEQLQQLSRFIGEVGIKIPQLDLFDSESQKLIIDNSYNALNFGISHAMLISFLLSILGLLSCAILWRRRSKEAAIYQHNSG